MLTLSGLAPGDKALCSKEPLAVGGFRAVDVRCYKVQSGSFLLGVCLKFFFFFCSVFKRHSVATILGHVIRVDSRQSGTSKRSYLPCWSVRPQENEGCGCHVAAHSLRICSFSPHCGPFLSPDRTNGCGSKASQSLACSLVHDKGMISHSTGIPFIILIWKIGVQERDVSSHESKTKHSWIYH